MSVPLLEARALIKDAPILLEQITAYKPVISIAIEPRNADESDKLDEVLEIFRRDGFASAAVIGELELGEPQVLVD